MKHKVARIKGLGFVLWHARHEFYHILLGLVWSWFLREQWGEFNVKWVWLAVFGSLLPDVDHLLFFFGYGREHDYTKHIIELLRKHEWRKFVVYVEHGHKYQTGLSYHNYYIVLVFLSIGVLSSFFDWQSGVVFFGAIVIHYIFDIFDDLMMLGEVNANWTRWGREKK